MKKKLIQLLSLTILVFVVQSCTKDSCEREYTFFRNVPIYHSWDEIRIDIKTVAPRTLRKPGKIYFYNNYILINEQREGIHIIDNSTPASPQFVSFIPIPGNLDMAVRNNTLYADNYTDLLAIDINNLFNVQLIKRVQEAFPDYGRDPALGVLTHYEEKKVTEIVDCNSVSRRQNGDLVFAGGPELLPTGLDNNSSGGDGIGGSFARFTLYGDYLYTVSDRSLLVFDLHQTDCPVKENSVWIGWGIETIFPYDGRLFIGADDGMSIYDLGNPTAPEYISGYSHWTGCDPVFVDGDYAYVTIHSGQTCNGGTLNQLDVLDISDIFNPVLEKSFSMENPHGLSVKEEVLYLCEGEFGLKVFDVTNPLKLNEHLLTHLPGFAAYDVIALPGLTNTLLLIGDDGFYQFDVNDPENPIEISRISVER